MKVQKLLSPINPCNIFLIGLNYLKHYEEGAKKRGIPLPDKPVLFMKPTTCVTNPNDPIVIPHIHHGDQLDYEAELAIVIGRRCRNVREEEALKYVLGYCCANDVSARYWQKKCRWWTMGSRQII